MDESKSSKFITGGWSSAEIGGALVIQCLGMIKIMTSKASQAQNGVQFIKPIKPHILANAMSSSIVNSPSRIVRSSALPVFKQLLSLHEREGKSSIHKDSITDIDDSIYFHSPSLSVLIGILPVGRNFSANKIVDCEEISSRCSVLFDLVINYISNTWSSLSDTMKQKAMDIFKLRLQNLSAKNFAGTNLSSPPHLEGIDELGVLLTWLVMEFKLLRVKDCSPVSTYMEGILSLIQSIAVIFGSTELNSGIAGIQVDESHSLLQLLFESSTFYVENLNSRATPRFTTLGIRKKIMDLLSVLCKGSEQNLQMLFKLMFNHLYSHTPRTDLIRDWSIDPMLKQKSVTGHVGMKNQGATCYLNSLLQQFFHTPALRLGLLSCEVSNENDASNEHSDEHRMLFELQRLFGNLLMSEKRDFDTVDLVKSIRGYDGNPIRPGEQQDVDEFFNLFCDRLETALKNLPQSRLLHNVFGGQLSHLITCQKCHYSSERIEDFLSISLDVKGKHDIFESLQSYIQGEVLDGANKYLCSKCNAKRDSIKRCCIKTLPNVLICHLKRFDFDLEMLRKVKVNDRFEFPTMLNMKKYTKECLDETNYSDLSWRGDNYYNYTLRGVLVHTGTADSGHYYSLSHVRNYTSTQSDQSHGEGSWFCFNDSIVSPFDPSTLEISTFGGLNDSNNIGQLKRFDSAKSYSAYLLIYDRVDQYEFDEQISKEPKKMQMNAKSLDIQSWTEGIVQENLRHAKDQIVFSPEYGAFVVDVCKATLQNTQAPSTFKAMQVLTFYLIENLLHARDRNVEIENIFGILHSWYQKSIRSCLWLLELLSGSHKHWMEKIFLHCYRPEIRKLFTNLLEVIFQKSCPSERENYYNLRSNENEPDPYNEDSFDTDSEMTVHPVNKETATEHQTKLNRVQYWKSKSVLAFFIGTVLSLLDDCEVHWRRFDQIFECLIKFANCGQDEAIFLIRCGTILRLVDLYQGEKGNVLPGLIVRPPPKTNEGLHQNEGKSKTRLKMGDRDKRPNFLPLLSLLSTLICSGTLHDENDSEVSDSDSDSSIEGQESFSSAKTGISNISDCFMTDNSLKVHQVCGIIYELPRRDSFFVTRRELLETMMNEVAPHNVYKDQSHHHNLSKIVSRITCHICFGNLEKTFIICALAKRIIKDRKANESTVAIQVLKSLIHIRDRHIEQRIQSVATCLFEGLDANAEYEKELLLLLRAIHSELLRRTTGAKIGCRDEVYFHSIIVNNLDKIISLYGQNITNPVKHKILGLVKSLLTIQDSSLSFGKNDTKSTQIILSAYSGYNLQDPDFPRLDENSTSQRDPCDYMDEEVVKDKIFSAMKDLYMNVVDAIVTQCSPTRNEYFVVQGHNNLSSSQLLDSATFSEYFFAMRQCLTGPMTENRIKSDKHWIFDVTKYLLPAFWEVDNGGRNQHRPPADILKGEIIMFFERLAQLNSKQFLHAMLDGSMYSSSSSSLSAQSMNTAGKPISDPITKMMEVFVTSNNNFDFNNTYMVHFYSLLALLAEKNNNFSNAVLNHENWKWALRAFVLNQNVAKPGPLYKVILRNTIKYVEDNEKFRNVIFRTLVPNDGKDSSLEQNRPNSAALKLLNAILDSEILHNENQPNNLFCVSTFVSGECGGMSKISAATKKVFSQLPDTDLPENSFQTSTLEDLYQCVNCMDIILRYLDIKDVKNVMTECWPEVDELNSIFTQIITMTEEEWMANDDENQRKRKYVLEIVSISRNLQGILITASTFDGRRQ